MFLNAPELPALESIEASTMENILRQKYKLPKSAAKNITAEAKSLLNLPDGATYSKSLESQCVAIAEDKGYLQDGMPVEKLPQRTSWIPSDEHVPHYESKTLTDSDDQSVMTNFSKMTTASAPPGMSKYGHGGQYASRKKGGRRASTSFIPETEDPFGDDAFGSGFGDWGTSHSTSKGSRRTSADGGVTSSAFGGEDPFASIAGRSTNGKPPKHRASRRHSSCAAPPHPAEINGVSEEFLFSGSKHKSSGSHQNGEIAVPTLYEKRKTKNPLFMIPDPVSQHREEQQAQDDFFAEMDRKKGKNDDPFADSDEGSMGEFSDDGTINWDEGGVIVPKKEKYNKNGSASELSGSATSFLNSSNGELKPDRKKSRPPGSDRKRLSGLEKRNSRRGLDDELTTATPSTRFSTDSEYSASTTRSRKSTASGVELKTGSLLSDLVLIMDGKMDVPEGSEPSEKEPRPSRRGSSGGGTGSGTRPSRRRSNGGGRDDDDPFVVRSEVRGAEMGAFVKGPRHVEKSRKTRS